MGGAVAKENSRKPCSRQERQKGAWTGFRNSTHRSALQIVAAFPPSLVIGGPERYWLDWATLFHLWHADEAQGTQPRPPARAPTRPLQPATPAPAVTDRRRHPAPRHNEAEA